MDSLPLIVSSFQYAAEKINVPIPDASSVKPLIGLGLPEAIRAAFPDREWDDCSMRQFKLHYSDVYVRKSADGQRLYPGALELLEALVALGCTLAVATGKSRVGLERALDQSGARELFAFSRCADETCSKPNPQMLEEILAESGVAASRAMMVGDTHFDLEMANAASMLSVGVSYGAQEIALLEKSNPAYIAHSMQELSLWLTSR